MASLDVLPRGSMSGWACEERPPAAGRGYLAGYGIRAMLITQDLSQHQGVYGKKESITANCHLRIAFAANKPETAELLSQMAGDTTVSHKQVSYRGGRFDLVMDQRHITRRRCDGGC